MTLPMQPKGTKNFEKPSIIVTTKSEKNFKITVSHFHSFPSNCARVVILKSDLEFCRSQEPNHPDRYDLDSYKSFSFEKENWEITKPKQELKGKDTFYFGQEGFCFEVQTI